MRRCGVGQQLLLIKFRSPDNTYWIKIVRKKGSDAKRIKIKRCGGGQRKHNLLGGQEGSAFISAQAEVCRPPALCDPAILCYYLVSFSRPFQTARMD